MAAANSMVMTCLLVEILDADAGPEEATVPEADTARPGFLPWARRVVRLRPGWCGWIAGTGPVDRLGDLTGRASSAKGPVTRTVTDHDLVLVVDFGAQYAQLIARRVREARVYSEIVPHTMPVAEMLAQRPEGDHPVRRSLVGLRARCPRTSTRRSSTAGVPVFGMCYGFQAMALRPRRRGRTHRPLGVRPHARRGHRRRHAARRRAPPSTGCG